jgi:hypothetical protein
MRQAKSKDTSSGTSDKGRKGADSDRSGGGPAKRPRV